MTALNRSNPLPLWAQLEGDLRARILGNEFDEQFPTDEQLVQQYKVSRHTVREAVRRLQGAGLVQRERGRGSSVAKGQALEQSTARFYSLAASIEEQGLEEHSSVLVQSMDVNDAAASHLGLAAGAALVHVRRLRFAGQEPLALDDSWLPPNIGTQLLTEDLEQGSLYARLATAVGVTATGGSERIRAVIPAEATRELLALPDGEAALRIERLVLSDGLPIEWRESIVRGDRFTFLAEWTAQAVPD